MSSDSNSTPFSSVGNESHKRKKSKASSSNSNGQHAKKRQKTQTNNKQQAPSSSIICCSCPGKVLMTGGYLVLEHPNPGLVLTISARFYTKVEEVPSTISTHFVQVISRQFHQIFQYSIDGQKLNRLNDCPENPFIENAILYAFIASGSRTRPRSLRLEIFGDNAFYSQRDNLKLLNLPYSSHSLKSMPRFAASPSQAKGTVKKTGLGSSAALVTSIVGALMSSLSSEFDLSKDQDLSTVHYVSQLVHCIAQGKIGSGFDVSCAVYGSQRFVRFEKKLLEQLMDTVSEQGSALQLTKAIEAIPWNNEHKPFSLPPHLHLVLADVTAGSNTPSMVRKVLAAKETKRQTVLPLWQSIAKHNQIIEKQFKALHRAATNDRKQYESVVRTLGAKSASQWPTSSSSDTMTTLFVSISQTFRKIRSQLKRLGEIAGTPIEPDEQTRLIDATMALEGVLMAGVPGAGGFDAVFAIVMDQSKVEALERLWSSWKEMNVLPLVLQHDPNGIVKEKEVPNVTELKSISKL